MAAESVKVDKVSDLAGASLFLESYIARLTQSLVDAGHINMSQISDLLDDLFNGSTDNVVMGKGYVNAHRNMRGRLGLP